jgi:hypothetical protein
MGHIPVKDLLLVRWLIASRQEITTQHRYFNLFTENYYSRAFIMYFSA